MSIKKAANNADSKERTSAKRRLIIVESPTKAKTIKKMLGRGYTVHASVGHIRDIESRGIGKKAFGIDFENGYEPHYTVIPGKKKNVAELMRAVKKADEVYLAPDMDREGEAIAWHLKEALELSDERAMRIAYRAVTKKAITEALGNPRQIDMRLVNAQKGRRVLDRIVGFSLSPFLWKKITGKLSAGRVQSVALRLIVERDREIKSFVPREFWKIEVDLHAANGNSKSFTAALTKWEGENFGLGGIFSSTESEAKRVANALREADYMVSEVQNKETYSRPAAPFITSTLQQAASSQLRFGIRRTMQIAQKLYEGIEIDEGPVGLITYMRTDSPRLDHNAVNEIRDWIAREHPRYLRASAPVYGPGAKGGIRAQDAHEGIRPTSANRTPTLMKPFLSGEQFKLYELIWRRAVASQMKDARYSVTTIKLAADRGIFEARGRITLFDGFTILTPEVRRAKEEYQSLPSLEGGDALVLDALRNEQNWTKPIHRYTEASLVKTLEKQGIGRPSTYAAIIQTIRERGYVLMEKRAFYASELGIAVNDILLKEFPNILDYCFTAEMEGNLDAVEGGEVDWHELVDNFYKPFATRVEEAIKNAEPLKGRIWEGEQKCPVCGKELVIRYSKSGAFLGCSNYPDCKGLLPFPGEDGGDDEDDEESVKCPKCGRLMRLRSSRFGKFYSCTGYPECGATAGLTAEGKPIFLPDIELDCDECGTPMETKSKARGPAMVCPNTNCRRELPIRDGKPISLPKANGARCEKCGNVMIVRLSKRGPFLACTGFPKCRNIKDIAAEP